MKDEVIPIEFILKRIYEKKDQLLDSSKKLIDLWEEKNIVELKKELQTITHCLSELEPFATRESKSRFSSFNYFRVTLDQLIEIYTYEKFEAWGTLVTAHINSLITMANSISIRPSKKGFKIFVKGKIPNLAEIGIERGKEDY